MQDSSSNNCAVNCEELELAVSSGGSAAVLAGVGTFLACEVAGIRKFRRLFGVSGGSIVTALAACGLSAKQMISLALEVEFDQLISMSDKCFWRSWKRNRSAETDSTQSGHSSNPDHIEDPDWKERPWTGLFGTSGLNRVIRERTEGVLNGSAWPDNYATLATTKDGAQVVFNRDGAFHIALDGKETQLANKPVPLAFAVRASSTIPGVLSALSFKGITLFDGALSRDGLCPVGVLIRRFGADPKKILACRVGEDNLKPVLGRLHRAARLLWRIHPHFHWGPETEGVMEFRPPIDHVQTLKFKLTPDEKWYAILVSFETCISRLAVEGILHGDGLQQAREILASLRFWRDLVPAPKGAPQLIAMNAERSFREHGML